jgi:hypothetical protein
MCKMIALFSNNSAVYCVNVCVYASASVHMHSINMTYDLGHKYMWYVQSDILYLEVPVLNCLKQKNVQVPHISVTNTF